MAKLINVIKDTDKELERRQLPLVIDEKLTMVLDLIDVDFICEYPKIYGKDKELFHRKFNMLSIQELKEAFQVSCKRILDIVSEIISCVGCRKSVERLFHQMKTGSGRSALYPLVVTPEGILILSEEMYNCPNVIGAMFYNHISKLNNLSTSWSRSKKNSRCALHSLDAQRYVRPLLGSGWHTLWECMVPFCKQEVATIDTSQLLSTLETYLQKHRFCTECRTKVMKAYSLLVDEPENQKTDNSVEPKISTCDKNNINNINTIENECNKPIIKEKGFVPSLYAGIRRCSPNNHIHVEQRTDYIMSLILAAEPELIGNRRERHAKTLEIAQEEVLVCVGLCLYERIHRIQLRLREEQTTCQLLGLVAVNALSTKFQLAVEMKQGISQLELLFQEFRREDRIKQRRKQVRKLKKRRKKERKNAGATLNTHSSGTIINNDDEDADSDNDEVEKNINNDNDDDDKVKIPVTCFDSNSHVRKPDVERNYNIDCVCLHINNNRIMKIVKNDMFIPKYSGKKDNNYCCSKYESKKINQANFTLEKYKKSSSSVFSEIRKDMITLLNDKKQKIILKHNLCRPDNEFIDISSIKIDSSNSGSSIYSKYHVQKDTGNNNIFYKSSNIGSSVIKKSIQDLTVSCDCCFNVQIDCGYGSADNNAISSIGSGDSSVDSSEVACSEGFCNHDGNEECNFDNRPGNQSDCRPVIKKNNINYDRNKNSMWVLNSTNQSLQQMLTEITAEREHNIDNRAAEYIIPMEEIERYKSSMGYINEKRKQLRQTLKSRFAQLCLQQQFGILPLPRTGK